MFSVWQYIQGFPMNCTMMLVNEVMEMSHDASYSRKSAVYVQGG